MENSYENQFPIKTVGWAAHDRSGILSPFTFSRRETGEEDVRFKVMFCGICHSDLHSIKNEWRSSFYPLVPGHETVGLVTEIGSKVKNFKVGDRVGVGCMVGACHSCDCCINNLEMQCPKVVFTYNDFYSDRAITYGGYSDHMVANERYVVRIPDNLSLDASAPLLCAGITTYSALKDFGLDKPGINFGIVGLGGLGHVGVKFAKAFGVKVTVISTSIKKKEEALKNLGADSFLLSSDDSQMRAAKGTLDGIIDTVSATHALEPLFELLKPKGKIVLVGAPEKPLAIPAFSLIMGRKMIAGTEIGGMKETQEMLDFEGEHNITADIEVISIKDINTAMKRLVEADVRYRFVIDIVNTL